MAFTPPETRVREAALASHGSGKDIMKWEMTYLMSSRQMPPWLQEQIVKMQQSQENLQSVVAQRERLKMEQIETARALEELGKISDEGAVFKHAGSAMIKSTKKDLIDEMEERQEMSKTRLAVLEKQEARLRESLKTQEASITAAMKGGGTPSQPKENPRK